MINSIPIPISYRTHRPKYHEPSWWYPLVRLINLVSWISYYILELNGPFNETFTSQNGIGSVVNCSSIQFCSVLFTAVRWIAWNTKLDSHLNKFHLGIEHWKLKEQDLSEPKPAYKPIWWWRRVGRSTGETKYKKEKREQNKYIAYRTIYCFTMSQLLCQHNNQVLLIQKL